MADIPAEMLRSLEPNTPAMAPPSTDEMIFDRAHEIATLIVKSPDANRMGFTIDNRDSQTRRAIERATEISRITADIVEAVAKVDRG